jgi:hypothetical protein
MVVSKHRPISEIIKNFKFQSQTDDCWAVCIHNVLEELAARTENPALKQSESNLNKAMGYGGKMGALSIRVGRVRPNLNRLLEPLGYRIEEEKGVTLQGLARNLAKESTSYPIAGLSYEYLRKKKSTLRLRIEGEPPVGFDHAVVVLKVDSNEVVFFDPLERFSRGGKGNDGLITLGAPTYLAYWSHASVEKEWMMYAVPISIRKGATQGRLEVEYNEAER